MQFIYIENSRKEEWERLVKANPASGYMQSFFWAEFRNMLGWETYKIGILESDKLVGGAVVAKYSHHSYGNFLSISEGPVLPYGMPQVQSLFERFLQEIDSIADLTGTHRTSHINIEPKLENIPPSFARFVKAPMDQQPLRTLLIPLVLSETDLLTQMKPKGRYNIGVAKRHGVVIEMVPIEKGIVDFVALYHTFVHRMKIDGKDDSYFECLAHVLQKEKNAFVYHARYKDKIIASAIIIDYGKTTTFLFGASSDEHPSVMAPYLLHWEIIRAAKKRGQKVYDFYSLVPDPKDVKHPWYGFSQFKLKFGGTIKQYVGGYDFIYNPTLYHQYLKISS